MNRISQIRAFIGTNTRRAREKKGWSQQTLAEKTGLDETTIRKLELGTHGGLRTFVIVADTLGVTVGSLFKTVKVVKRASGRPRKKTKNR